MNKRSQEFLVRVGLKFAFAVPKIRSHVLNTSHAVLCRRPSEICGDGLLRSSFVHDHAYLLAEMSDHAHGHRHIGRNLSRKEMRVVARNHLCYGLKIYRGSSHFVKRGRTERRVGGDSQRHRCVMESAKAPHQFRTIGIEERCREERVCAPFSPFRNAPAHGYPKCCDHRERTHAGPSPRRHVARLVTPNCRISCHA